MLPNLFKTAGLLAALSLTAPVTVWAAEPGWLTVKSPRSGQTILCLSVSKVKSLTLLVHHSYDQRPVAESFVITAGRLVPTQVVFDSDTYDLRRSRYASSEVETVNHQAVVRIKHTRPHDRLAAIRGRVAHGVPQVLLVHDQQGSRRLSLDALGPGGTPYFIGVLPGPSRGGKQR